MTRGQQVEQTMAELCGLALHFRAAAANTATTINMVMSADRGKAAPEVIAAARQLETLYRAAAAKLTRMAKKLEPYTLSEEEGYGNVHLDS